MAAPVDKLNRESEVKMNPGDRLQLAQELCAQMAAAHPGDIILAGAYGSTARGTDTPWSDLEMTFVVRDGSGLEGKHLLYRGIAVGYAVYEQSKLEESLANPGLEWPFLMGMLNVLKVLHGDPAQLEGWLQLGQATPPERFKATLESHLPGLVIESYGRILSCRQRGDTSALYPSVLEVLFEMNLALCLLNRRWVTHDYYQGLQDAFDFPKLPKAYSELVPALYHASTFDDIVPLAETLVHNFWQLLAEEGIQVYNYQNVTELPL
jgi:kanamycin nucleotidyltransferase